MRRVRLAAELNLATPLQREQGKSRGHCFSNSVCGACTYNIAFVLA
jgi:hypothetical protein